MGKTALKTHLASEKHTFLFPNKYTLLWIKHLHPAFSYQNCNYYVKLTNHMKVMLVQFSKNMKLSRKKPWFISYKMCNLYSIYWVTISCFSDLHLHSSAFWCLNFQCKSHMLNDNLLLRTQTSFFKCSFSE